MVHDTLKLSGVILLRFSVPNCGSGSEGEGTWAERERDIIRGSRGFLQNVVTEHESINPSKYLQKGSVLGCVHTCTEYNAREFSAFSAGVDSHSF